MRIRNPRRGDLGGTLHPYRQIAPYPLIAWALLRISFGSRVHVNEGFAKPFWNRVFRGESVDAPAQVTMRDGLEFHCHVGYPLALGLGFFLVCSGILS